MILAICLSCAIANIAIACVIRYHAKQIDKLLNENSSLSERIKRAEKWTNN